MTEIKPFILMILDGWGINPRKDGNAVLLSGTPNLNHFRQTYPHTKLSCSGEAVGLPAGIMGNSEVGHLNIGAGRIVYQDLLRIDVAIREGTFFDNEVLLGVMNKVKSNNSALHLMGLVSDGGVHSQQAHLHALLDMARRNGVKDAFIHVILDGRDTPPDSGVRFVKLLQDHIRKHDYGTIATICGRYYAMDRDNRWERVEKAYRLYVLSEGIQENDPVEAVAHAYERGETDEFVKPIVINENSLFGRGQLGNNDGVIFFNYRSDRAREITRSLTDPNFNGFIRPRIPQLCEFVCMTIYDETFTLPIAYPPEHLEQILGQVISQNGMNQLRIAETEKYAHVTYFFNGGEEKPFPNEDRCLIPSPRDVPTYDHKPEMSARAVTGEVLSRLQKHHYHLIVLNFANMDMVGHTGILDAAITACNVVDECVGKIVPEILSQGGTAIITADHGNAEMMKDENGNPHTAHTTNPVPFILVDDSRKQVTLKEGILGDIAPTILHLLNVEQPVEMTGKSLIL